MDVSEVCELQAPMASSDGLRALLVDLGVSWKDTGSLRLCRGALPIVGGVGGLFAILSRRRVLVEGTAIDRSMSAEMDSGRTALLLDTRCLFL